MRHDDAAARRKESRGAICSECIVAAWKALSLIFRYHMQPRDHANSISLFGGRPRFIVRQMATRNLSWCILDCYPATSLSVSHLLSDVATHPAVSRPTNSTVCCYRQLDTHRQAQLSTRNIMNWNLSKFLHYYINYSIYLKKLVISIKEKGRDIF